MESQTVLIVSDDADFAGRLMECWQQDSQRHAPVFVAASPKADGHLPAHELAVVGTMGAAARTHALDALEAGRQPVICVLPANCSAEALRRSHPCVTFLHLHDDWEEPLVALGAALLRRMEAVLRARRAEDLAAEHRRYAALGRYVLEMRHSFNNALTSVLGNAELMLVDAGIAAGPREQLETIHDMGLRMHEIMQRLMSLDSEMKFSKRASPERAERAASAAGR